MSDNQLVPESGTYNQQQRRPRSTEKDDERPGHFFEPNSCRTNTPSPNQSFWGGSEPKLGNTVSPSGSCRSASPGIFPEYDCCSFDSPTPYNNYRAESMSISSFPDASSSGPEANTQTSIEPHQASSTQSRSSPSSRRSSLESLPCSHKLSGSTMWNGYNKTLSRDHSRPHFIQPLRWPGNSSSSSTSNVTDGNLSGDNSEI
ncbi:MAG: hypothetical protein MHMPM18_002018 [Marteilia pararefringens]